MASGDTPAARLRSVAERSIRERYFFWDWGEAIVTKGLLAAGAALGEPEFYRWVSRTIDRWIERSPQPFWPDHLGPGDALLDYWERSRQEHLLAFAIALGHHFERLPRASTGAPLNRADKPDLAHTVWVDSIHTDGPFLARLGDATGDARWWHLAAEIVHGQVASLQDPTGGLFAHAYTDTDRRTNGIFWTRGCGWAALGLAETLRWLPRDHPGAPRIERALRELVSSLSARQADDGHWPIVANEPTAPRESSASALIAEAVSIGLMAGVLDPGFAAVRDRAWVALAAAVRDGVVLGASERQPVSSDPTGYAKRAIGGCHAYAQGAWLLIASRMLHGSG